MTQRLTTRGSHKAPCFCAVQLWQFQLHLICLVFLIFSRFFLKKKVGRELGTSELVRHPSVSRRFVSDTLTKSAGSFPPMHIEWGDPPIFFFFFFFFFCFSLSYQQPPFVYCTRLWISFPLPTKSSQKKKWNPRLLVLQLLKKRGGGIQNKRQPLAVVSYSGGRETSLYKTQTVIWPGCQVLDHMATTLSRKTLVKKNKKNHFVLFFFKTFSQIV